MKNKKIMTSLGLAVLLFSGLKSQNASYSLNTIPISGTDNSAFGYRSLFSNSGTGNAAFGKFALLSNTSGNYNSAFGLNALYANTTGIYNNAFGTSALVQNTSGIYNTAIGTLAMWGNTTGNYNTSLGVNSLYTNASGSYNTSIGNNALYYNTGSNNTANGAFSLYKNTTGTENVGIGYQSLKENLGGSYNTATGSSSLKNNTSGTDNSAIGFESLLNNTTGYDNTAVGFQSLLNNTTGSGNTAIGHGNLHDNTTGIWNTVIGQVSLFHNTTGSANVAVGDDVLLGVTIESYNTAIGSSSGINASGINGSTSLGYNALTTASNKVRIGSTTVSSIEGQVAYSYPSDGRFKENINESDVKGLEFIKKLRPVVYNFNTKKFQEFLVKNMPDSIKRKYLADDFEASTAIRQSGFIAQEVETAAKEVGYNFNGVHKPENDNDNYSLAYSQFVVPLVKAVQEQQVQIEQDSKSINELKNQVEELKALLQANLNGDNKSKGFQTVNISDKNAIILDQNTPNPFAESTVISYNIPTEFDKAQIIFTTNDGKVIKSVNILNTGKGSLNIFASDLTSGIYNYTLVVDGKNIETKKLIKQ